MPRRPRILIVSSGHPCRNPRPLKEAATLGAAGYEVTLLTPNHDPALAALDRDLVNGQPFTHLRVASNRSFSRRLVRWLSCRAVTFGVQSIHALDFSPALFRAAKTTHADLTLVHNEVPHWIGIRLLAQGRRVAADMEDWHSEDLLPDARRHRPLRLLRANERHLLHRAKFVTTTSHALADALYASYGGNRAEVITNSFPLQPHSARTRNHDEPPALFWFSQTLGPGRGIERFLDAWRLTREPSRLVLLGGPVAGYATQLTKNLPPAFASKITFWPVVPPSELPALIASHDIGLALEPSEPANKNLTISNKILQYLNAGLAIVATDTAGQREVLARAPDAGVILPRTAGAAAIAHSLDQIFANRAALTARQQAARDLAETHYCWERESPRLLSLVEKALA